PLRCSWRGTAVLDAFFGPFPFFPTAVTVTTAKSVLSLKACLVGISGNPSVPPHSPRPGSRFGGSEMRLTPTMPQGRRLRSAVAAVEFAVVVPILVFIFVIALDWARIFYYAIIVENCARNGAMYAVDPYSTAVSPYGSLSQAALADCPDITPTPSV